MARIQDDPQYAAFMEFMLPARPLLAEKAQLLKEDHACSIERLQVLSELGELERDHDMTSRQLTERRNVLQKRFVDIQARRTGISNKLHHLGDVMLAQYRQFGDALFYLGNSEERLFKEYKESWAPIERFSSLYPGQGPVTRTPEGKFLLDGQWLFMNNPERLADDSDDDDMDVGH